MNRDTLVKTTCPYCGVGCGVDATVVNACVTTVSGDQDHPANGGRLCVKGSALHEVLGESGRLLEPVVAGKVVTWNDALDEVADELQRTISEHGPDSVAFYLSGQLLTEDYYVANKLMKGFIGSANVDTNSRLCMSSAVAGYKRAFGSDTVPCCYEDLELTDLLVMVGSNAAWNHPVLFQRIKKAKSLRPEMKVVVIDPRSTATCEIADLHLALKPGSDSALFVGLLSYLIKQQVINHAYVEQYTEGFESIAQQAIAEFPDLETVAELCGLPLERLKQFYDWYLQTEKCVTFYSQGVNQSSSGTDNANAIINCHLATGRIGREGMGPFSITGQPNAMGGREVGGLANQLAAHMDFSSEESIDRVARFWDSQQIARSEGLKAVELFQAIEEGSVKAVWVMGTNPVVSLPNTPQIERALTACPLVIVSECYSSTDTLAYADIQLPAQPWSEKDGTVTNSERRISRQRNLIPAKGNAKADWWIISEVAKRMGFAEAFSYQHPYQIFAEHAELSGFENNGQRDFDISLYSDIDFDGYDRFKPVQWPVTNGSPQGSARMFSDGRFFTPSGRARFITPQLKAPQQQPDKAYPLVVNTGRIRDQWHTMAMSGRSERLLQHREEPFVEIAAKTAEKYLILSGDLVEVSSKQGDYIGRARVLENDEIGANHLFVPMHWNKQFTSKGHVGTLIQPVTDPFSGQPESKHGVANIKLFKPEWQALLLSREVLATEPDVKYWSKVPKQNNCRYYLADDTSLNDPLSWCNERLGKPSLWLMDQTQQYFRAAKIEDEQLQWVLLLLPYRELPSILWLESLFSQESLSNEDRRYLLSITGCDIEDPGEIICSCYQVGSRQIEQAVEEGDSTVEQLGDTLKCGTNCGSCLPEINRFLPLN